MVKKDLFGVKVFMIKVVETVRFSLISDIKLAAEDAKYGSGENKLVKIYYRAETEQTIETNVNGKESNVT